MNRRDFLQIAPAASAALVISGLPVKTLAISPLLRLLGNQHKSNDRVLVLIQLIGGNDGLNMIVPLDQYSALSAARQNILIPENKVLPITGTSATGFHPAMSALQGMYDNGLMNIVQGVSYPNQNLSHFRATDIWLTGADATQYLDDGWLGRYLDKEHPGYPQGYPGSDTPDPLAIEIGNATNASLMGSNVNMGMSVREIDDFYNLINNSVGDVPATPAGHELKFIRYIAQQTQQYTGVLQTAAGKAKNLSALYPSYNALADQLKIVARLIAGGLQTPIYVVSLAGFDTHTSQVDPGDHTTGSHAKLLMKVSEAVTAFFDDCKLLGTDGRVAAVTFSEFGRRIISNGGYGTDHGTAEPIMVFGSGVNPGIIGSNPVIPPNATVEDNLEMQYDYRSVYAAILSDWFGIPATTMSDVLQRDYEILPIFKKVIEPPANNNSEMLSQNYPNPFSQTTTIGFGSAGGLVTILLLSADGRLVQTVTKQDYARGFYELTLSRKSLPAGNYYYKIINGRYEQTRRMTIIN